ncbi:MAG: HAMP domain-containing protein [Verrucomicrobia bacterium]|nr:HAMP domain-containing protein [Deltaproteobacteria bacterium]
MTLSRKIVLVIVSTFIALVFIVAATSDIILLKSFANLEKKVLKDNVSKVANEIEESFPELDASAKDYVEKLQQGGAEQIANLEIDSFATHRIDFIACYSRSGELVADRAANFHGGRYVELTHDQLGALRQATLYVIEQGGSRPWHGFLALDGNVAQFAIRPFVNGSVLLVGKYVDKEELGRIYALTKFVIDVSAVDADGLSGDFSRALTSLAGGATSHAAVVDNAHIAGYSLFNDVYGNPVLLLRITERRLIYEQGKVSISYILLAMIISGAVFCGVMLLFIRGAVLKRLATLISTVGAISRHGDISERLEIKGEDELEDLAGSINSMLATLESAKLALKESDRMYLDQIRQLNMELGYRAAELAVANKELESFNYSVSHDMRGPLTRISGYCQLMLDDGGAGDPQIRTYLSRIYESSCWLDEMIDAMLRLSQLARADFVSAQVKLSAIVEGVLRDLIQAEPKRAIDVVIAPDVTVVGDARLLKILASNLINNSWKYSAGSERTCIEFGVTGKGSLPVYFVRDNGAGFDMKDADKLFRVFTRLHDPTQFCGSGIGLATVQRVVARHGGRVWAEGQVGRGATFFFTLAPDVPVA